jgi:hypothetical protein
MLKELEQVMVSYNTNVHNFTQRLLQSIECYGGCPEQVIFKMYGMDTKF